MYDPPPSPVEECQKYILKIRFLVSEREISWQHEETLYH